MLMQLAGSMLAAFMTMLFIVTIGDGGGGWTLVLYGLSITRSLVHRGAGKDLLYRASNRFGGIDLYITVALIQSVLFSFIAWWQLDLPSTESLGVLLGLAVWPVCLAITIRMPRFGQFRELLPVTEDKGFEGASILMTVLGLSGVVTIVSLAVAVLGIIDIIGGLAIVIFLVLGVLLVRSLLHVHAGVSGLRETTFDSTVTRAKRYADFSVTTAFALTGVLLMFNIAGNGQLLGIALVGCCCWLLIAWPLIVRQFFSDRQITDLIAGDDALPHCRAPDAGLTNLGWLLLAHAMFEASLIIPDLFGTPLLLHVGDSSPWFAVGVTGLQAWAGAELIRMSPQSRAVATVFGVVGTWVSFYVDWPAVQFLQRLTSLPSPQTVASAGPLYLGLIIPAITLVLVNRSVTPVATARFRNP